jgi:hypothetical protein
MPTFLPGRSDKRRIPGANRHAGRPNLISCCRTRALAAEAGRSRMFFARLAAVALTALVVSSEAANAAGPYRPFQFGLWSGGAYTDDRTGGFSHCSAGVAYDSGIDMFIVSTAAHGWWLGFTNPQWSLTPSPSVPVKLRFDGRLPVDGLATVANGQLLLVPMPEDSHLIDNFRRSSQLTVIAQEQTFSLSLGGTSSVLAELTGCVRNSIALETSPTPSPPAPASDGLEAHAPTALQAPPSVQAVPPAPGSLEAQAPPSPPAPASLSPSGASRAPVAQIAAELEEVKLATNFLLAARLPNAHLIDADKPAALASFRAVWRSDDAAGAVKLIPPGRELTGMAIASDLISVDPKLCKGNFASSRSRGAVDRGVVFRAALSCADGQHDRTAQYFITPRPKGGFVVFAVIGNYAADGGSPANAQEIDSLNRAAVQAVGPDD